MRVLLICGLLAITLLGISAEPEAFLNVRKFGAKGDGVAKDTAAIQAAIDQASKQGGGTVLVPAGRYLSGTVRLKSNVTLHLGPGSTILASPDEADFDPYEKLPFQSVSDKETTYFHYGLVTAENVQNIAIVGQGTIDGNRTKRGGPKTIAIKLSQNISIRGITVQNAPNYAVSFWGCDYVDIDGIRVLNGYADGIDPDSSRYVRIANSYIDSWDDAICPKASPSMGMDKIRPVEHLTVTNCILRTSCNGFKFGTESSGDFRNVTVSNLTISSRERGRLPTSGIAIESVDGSNIDGVAISNVTMRDVKVPIFIRLANRGRGLEPAAPGTLKNVSIRNVIATGVQLPSSVTGIPGHMVERVTLDGINVTVNGGHQEPMGLDVPEHEKKYPDGTMFGVLPAYGLYTRHVDGFVLQNFHVRWAQPDVRPAIIADDVKDFEVNGFWTDTVTGSQPVAWFHDVQDALVRGARLPEAETFLRVTGAESKNVKLVGNDFTYVAQPVSASHVSQGTVIQQGNLAR